MRRPRLFIGSVGLALWAGALGACCAWTVSEQDIYWQIRAGDELWRGLGLPERDTWSFSVPGAPWLNIQWLATLVFRGLWGLGGEAGLVVGRVACVACLMGLLALGAAARMPRGRGGPVAVAASLALCHAALLPRLQLRSDFLVLLVYAAVQWRLLVPTRHRTARRVGLLLAVALAANLHAGTAPFVALLVACGLAGEPLPRRRRVAWVCGAGAALAATPYGARVVPLLWAHVRYFQVSVMANPDHQVLTGAYLAQPAGRAAVVAIVAGVAAAWALRARRLALPGALRQPLAATGLALALAAMACNRVRVLPYLIVLLPPLWLRALRLVRRRVPQAAAAGAALALATLLLGICQWPMRRHLGLGPSAESFPLGSVAFLDRARPRGQILHTFRFGAYMVWHLRAYPLYVDTRESMYWPLQQEILAAYRSPAETARLIDKYDVHTVLMPIPATRFVPGAGFEDVTARFMDRRRWALVYFDALSFVMVAREPAHAGLIAAHEYTLLRPNLPANSYPLAATRTAADDRRFVAEVARCRAAEPTNAFCRVAEASFWRVTAGAPADAARAATQLREVAAQLPSGSPPYLTAMVELQAALHQAGAADEAAAVEAALGPGTTVAPG